MRPRIRYEVVNIGKVAPMKVAIDMVKGRELARGKRESHTFEPSQWKSQSDSDQLSCSFYRATATDKNETLQQWISELSGWIVVTVSLGGELT